MRGASFILLAVLAACSERELRGEEAAPPADAADTGLLIDALQVRVDVLPSEPLDTRGAFRALPRTIGPVDVGESGADVGVVDLHSPVEVEGEVLAEVVTPQASGATLPFVLEPIPATILVGRPGTAQSYVARADDAGRFATPIVPHDQYELVVIPDDPRVPFVAQPLPVGSAPPFQALQIPIGAPIWGRVVDDSGAPLSGVEVYAVDTDGVRGASAYTGDDGRYVLYVTPDRTYDVVAGGRSTGRDPVLTRGGLSVAEPGVSADFTYEDLAPVFRSVSVVDASGAPLDDVTVRFTSKVLDGYPNGDARLTAEAVTWNGYCDVRLVAGTYQIELLPPPADDPKLDHSPLLVGDVVLEGSPDLADLVLPPMVEVSGTVRSVFGDPMAKARVSCREQAFGRREWTTFTDEDATWSMYLPQVPLTCTTSPPGSYQRDLASTRTTVDPSAGNTSRIALELVPGVPITGRVHLEGQPEPYAVIEVRSLSGALLGATLTEPDGYFALRIAP